MFDTSRWITLDRHLIQLINGWAGSTPWLDWLALSLVNDYLVPVVLATALFASWFAGRNRDAREQRQRAVLAAVLGVVLSMPAERVLLGWLVRPRPFQELHIRLLFYQPTDPSFPSEPAVVAFALDLGLYWANKKLGVAAFVLAGLFGLARVYAGVHYPIDVVAGAFLGLCGTALGSLLIKSIEPLPTHLLQWCRRWYLA